MVTASAILSPKFQQKGAAYTRVFTVHGNKSCVRVWLINVYRQESVLCEYCCGSLKETLQMRVSDYFQCNWKELKANFKHKNWKVNLIQKWILCSKYLWFSIQGKFLYASIFCFSLSDFTGWGFESTMQKKKLFEFSWRCYFNTLITQKESSNSKM